MKLSKRSLEILGTIYRGEELPWAPKTLGKLRTLELAAKQDGRWVCTADGVACLATQGEYETTADDASEPLVETTADDPSPI